MTSLKRMALIDLLTRVCADQLPGYTARLGTLLETLRQWLASIDILGSADEKAFLAADVVALVLVFLLAVMWLPIDWDTNNVEFTEGIRDGGN